MENIILQKKWVQGAAVVPDDLRGTAFTGENGAHTFRVTGIDANQDPVTITGTITGKFLAANNVTVPLTGSIDNGAAVLTLTEDCYAVPGRFIVSIFATNDGTTLCIYCGVGNVFRTESSIVAYPSASIPDIQELIDEAQAVSAQVPGIVSAAQTAVDGIEDQKNTMIASIASVAGQGTDTTLTQSGVAADAKATGDAVGNLKSAFEQDYIPWDVNGDGKYILANGTIESGSGAANFHYTALIDAEQNTPYTFTYLYTGQFACRIHGYNSSGTWVKQLGYFVSTNTTAYNTINFVIDDASIVYFRISIHKYLASYLTLYNGNNTVYSDAVEHKSSRLSNVPTATANAIAKCAQSYIDHNDNFIYGTDGTATKYNANGYIDSETGKYRIDCSTFALLVIMGCDYDHSMYKTTDTNVFGAMGYGYNPFAGYTYPWNNQKLYGTYTWQMCYEYTKAGYTFDVINRNFGNVQPGDLIFWGSTANGVQGNYKRIHHVDVVVARYGTDDCVVADAGSVPIQLKRAKQRVESDDIAIVARLPLGIAQTTEKYHMNRHYETPVSQLVITLPTTIKHYSPCAMKVKIHQTAASGSFSVSGVYLAGETLGSSTNGETFELTKTGYFSADAARVQINATGAEILDIWFGTPAAVVDWSDENYKQFEHDVVITWDAASSGKYIGSDGSIGSSGSFHYSDLIPCIQGNGRILLTYSGSSVGTRLHGYDSTGTWVKQLGNVEGMVGNAELNFTVNDTSIKYVRISCPKSASVKMWQTNDPYIDYTQWYGKKWYAYGTSLTSATKGKYANYLANMSGMYLSNKGIEGGGITNNGGTSTGQVKTAIMNTSDGKTEADLITWEIGANEGSTADSENDLFDTSDNTFCGLFNQCIRYLMENTSAQIVVMYSPSGKTNPDTVQWYHKRKEFVRKLCQINGVYFIGEPNVFGYGRMKDGAYNVDNIHQNDLGGYNLACFMWSKLKDIPCWYDSIPEGASNA